MDGCDDSPGESGTVKWYDRDRGYGFVLVDGTGAEAFLHSRILLKDGISPVSQGDRIHFTSGPGRSGLRLTSVRRVERAVIGSASAGSSLPVHITGWVKFFDTVRGYGFVTAETGEQVFLGAKTLRKLGVATVRAEQEVRLTAIRGPDGLVAETLQFAA